MDQNPLETLESLSPFIERRNPAGGDPVVLMLLKQLHTDVKTLDKKISDHITDEPLTLAESVLSLMQKSFYKGDAEGHKSWHEEQYKVLAERSAFWKKLRFEIYKYGLIGFLGWLLYAAWASFLQGPPKGPG